MKHISEVWDLLEKCKTEEELEAAIGEIPNKFGIFTYERINKDTVTVINSYLDESRTHYREDRVDFDIPQTKQGFHKGGSI